MKSITENIFIENLTRNFSRSPMQINKLQESDAELIQIPGTSLLLAITTDSIVEEIESGLYNDPYMIGWMTVMASMSDLAAVGAEPIGILLNQSLPRNIKNKYLYKIQDGINDACNKCNIHVIGGDTNFSSSMQMSGCGIGFVKNNSFMTRIGCKPGDYLFSSGKLGRGNSYALFKLSVNTDISINPITYKPKAKLDKGQLICDYANCCMDTSDGFISTIDQLMRLNNIGIIIDNNLQEIIDHEAIELSNNTKIPEWMMLAGPHGEFELLFTIPPSKIDSFLKAATSVEWEPVRLGKVVKSQGLNIMQNEKQFSINTGMIRNLFDEVNGDIEKYIQELFKIDQLWPHE